MKLVSLISNVIERLQLVNIDNPHLDARVLIAQALGVDRTSLLSQSERELNFDELSAIEHLISRRIKHEPVARILGFREFWGLNFGLNEATLEPRPDSETLVEAVLTFCLQKDKSLRILDLGTGTGCLLLSLLHELPNSTGLGIDVAPRAIEQAQQNAQHIGIRERATFRTNDWLQDIEETFDIIVSNPPYIPANVIPKLTADVRDFDPIIALDGGTDGLDVYRNIIPKLEHLLKPQGLSVLEVGFNQASNIVDLFRTHRFEHSQTHKDLSGIDRCVSALAPKFPA